MSRDAVVASVENEQDTVKKLRADIAQLHTEKVTCCKMTQHRSNGHVPWH